MEADGQMREGNHKSENMELTLGFVVSSKRSKHVFDARRVFVVTDERRLNIFAMIGVMGVSFDHVPGAEAAVHAAAAVARSARH